MKNITRLDKVGNSRAKFLIWTLWTAEFSNSGAWFPPNGNFSAASSATSGIVHRRSLVEKIGEWKDYRTLDLTPDTEFRRRAMRTGAKTVHVENLSVFKFPSAWRKNV